MRKRFEQQMTLGRLPISETEVPTKKEVALFRDYVQP